MLFFAHLILHRVYNLASEGLPQSFDSLFINETDDISSRSRVNEEGLYFTVEALTDGKIDFHNV